MLMVFSLQGCTPFHDQHDYPSRVKFSKGGGEQTVCGSVGCDYVEIYNQKGETEAIHLKVGENEQCSLQFKWLTVIHNTQTHQFTIRAEPNTTKKKRMLTIYAIDGNTWLEIFVTQSK